MTGLLELDIKKWYLRLSVLHLTITILYLILFKNFLFDDFIGFNMAFHGFYWFSYVVPGLFKRQIPSKNHRFLKVYLKAMSYFMLLFGIIIFLVSANELITYSKQITLLPISFAAVAPICAGNFHQQADSMEV